MVVDVSAFVELIEDKNADAVCSLELVVSVRMTEDKNVDAVFFE